MTTTATTWYGIYHATKADHALMFARHDGQLTKYRWSVTGDTAAITDDHAASDGIWTLAEAYRGAIEADGMTEDQALSIADALATDMRRRLA